MMETQKEKEYLFEKELSYFNTFTGNPLDKVNNQRHSEEFVQGLLRNESSKFLPSHQLKMLLAGSQVIWKTEKELKEELELEFEQLISLLWILLGMRDGIAYFVVELSQFKEDKISPILRSGGKFEELRMVVYKLSMEDASILAQARCFLQWHSKHLFCAVCGAPSISIQGGSKRKCTKCDANHFPRTDPVVIAAVFKGDKCLLGRKSIFPKGMWSALAGFIEPAESFEEAARREIFEESNIRIGKVTYHSSQPWPYPSQLMIGCIAEALTEDIIVDKKEMEDIQWFSKEQVRAAVEVSYKAMSYTNSEEFRIPPPSAIAHQIIKSWCFS